MKQALKQVLALLLCLALLGPVTAFAEGEDATLSLVDTDELDQMLYDYIYGDNLNPENISVGFYYSATGERYYFNENKWYYSASMYKVPLMMILAERERNGELTQESVLNGLTLEYAEQSILVYSNNDFAHLMMNYIGSDRYCRELYQQYSDLPVEDYDPDFYDYSYFTARFMTDVMVTLYNDPERFPHIIDRLKEAQPGEYFRRYLGDRYEIAQKYGSYTDWSSRDFNHTSGIIYTEHPIVLTVMTVNTPNHMGVIADLAARFTDYAVGLDEQYDQWEREQQEAAEAARAAEEAALAEEQARILAEQEAAAAAETAAPETPVPTPVPMEAPAAAQTAQSRFDVRILVLVVAALLVAAVLLIAIGSGRRKRRKQRQRRREAALRQTQWEVRRARQEQPRQDRRYTPKH